MLAVVMSLVPVAVVHEDVHQWTGEEDEVRQRAEQMGGVLGDQMEAAHGNYQGQCPAGG